MTDLMVPCPTCNKTSRWCDENAARPFCSERCQLIDLGDWASGKRCIAADAEYDDMTAQDLHQD